MLLKYPRPIHNQEIAEKFDQIADFLEIKGANKFRARAYRKAAHTVRQQPLRLEDMVQKGRDLTELADIGDELAAKIKEMVRSGDVTKLRNLKKKMPIALLDLLNIKGLGPKRIKTLYEELGITDRDDLEKALKEGNVKKLPGFGSKIKKNIIEELKKKSEDKNRIRIDKAENLIKPLCKYLENFTSVDSLHIAGSYRRRKETIGDIDILAVTSKSSEVMDRFTDYEEVDTIVSKGDTKSTVMLRTGLQVDLRTVEEKSKSSALLYFTGSKEHNIALRRIGMDRGYKLNEYGVFKDDSRIEIQSEENIYKLLDLNYVEPELRENRGEIEASSKGKLPKLVKRSDIRGDLQMHTKYSDGKNSIESMARKCMEMGYDYVAITDHSAYVGVTNGLGNSEVAEYRDKIQAIDNEFEDIKLLAGIEVDVLEDGSLDLVDEVLKKLDIVMFSIHSGFELEREKQTERILNAIDNRYTNIFAHPTGRIINKRKGYDYDIEKVMRHAKESDVIFELNASPSRLDLNDINANMAKDLGVKISISTDAHSTQELRYMKYGIWQARRAWIEAKDVLNALDLEKLTQKLER